MGIRARRGIASFLEAERFFHLSIDHRYGTTFGFQCTPVPFVNDGNLGDVF